MTAELRANLESAVARAQDLLAEAQAGDRGLADDEIEVLQDFVADVPKLLAGHRARSGDGLGALAPLDAQDLRQAESLLADPDAEDCERFTSRYGRRLLDLAKACGR